MLYLRIAVIAGLIIATPLIFWQVWLFVAPALYAKERRYAIPFVVLSSVGFIGGAAFSHYVAFPLMWRFFAELLERHDDVHAAHRRRPSACTCACCSEWGWSFRCRRWCSSSRKMGVVTARWMVRQFKYAVLVIFVVAAVITPSADVASQLIVAVPMIVLYILSIAIAWLFGPKKRNAEL